MRKKTKANIIELDALDQRTLDALAAAERRVALWGERGYKPAVIRRFLSIFRNSGLTPDEFMRREYVFSLVNP